MAGSVAPSAPRRAPWGAAADLLLSFPLFFLVVGLQSPGKIVSDTKYDLLVDPIGFLERSLHLWTDQSFSGQVQNQSYGYLFPHGAFFALGQLAHIPPWLVERAWWALALTLGFCGMLRLAAALGIGRLPARIVGALAFVATPKVLVSLGTISSEIWPMMLAPWVLLAVHAGLTAQMTPRRAGAGAALACGAMGAVNAVATAAACVPAALWLLTFRADRTWRRLAAWWVGLTVLISLWWIVPLLLLGQVAPPFLDYIEASGVTSRWAAAAEVLRGTGYWVPFVSVDIPANGAVIATPGIIVATAIVAAAGLTGLTWPAGTVDPAARDAGTGPGTRAQALPHRGRLVLLAAAGMLVLTAAYIFPGGGVWSPSSPLASAVQSFLDGSGAPLRNLHKFEPLLRLPLALGLVYLLDRAWGAAVVPRQATRAQRRRAELARLAHPERHPGLAVVAVVAVALVATAAPAWRGELAANGAHEATPGYWQDAAGWLVAHAEGQRALVAPGSSFGMQIWGVSRDEPLQPLAQSPWAVRDAIPLQPAPAIRALDSVQRVFDSGRPEPGLAATLRAQGIGYVVVRADLVARTTATRPALVHRVLRESGGFTEVAAFGEPVGAPPVRGQAATATVDHNLRLPVEPVVIYRVGQERPTDPYTVPLAQVPQVLGAPEVLARLDSLAAQRRGASIPSTTRLLAADAAAAGIAAGEVVGTDTPVERETDFGRFAQSTSAIRAQDEERTTHNPAPDYAAAVDPEFEPGRTHLHWAGGTITASSSAAWTDQVGPVLVGRSVPALADGDPRTAWHSRSGVGFGERVRIDLDAPRDRLTLRLLTPDTGADSPVNRVTVRSERGSVVGAVEPGEETTIALPAGASSWVTVTASGTERGNRGFDFAISELGLSSDGQDVLPTPSVQVPPAPGNPAGWVLGTDFPGRAACLPGDEQTACAAALAQDAEEPGRFTRTLTTDAAAEVRPVLSLRGRPGPELDRMLAAAARAAGEVFATGDAELDDPLAGPSAAVDGDAGTAWIAPANSRPEPEEDAAEATEPEGAADNRADTTARVPELTVHLPRPERVGAVRIAAPPLGAGAVPERIEVRIGDRTVPADLRDLTRQADDSWIVDTPFARTEKVTIRILTWTNVRDSGDGAVALPPALGEVRLLDADRRTIAPPLGTTERPVTVPCSAGPTVSLDDGHGEQFSRLRMALRTSVAALRTGRPILAAPCGAALKIPAGTTTVAVDPTAALSVDAVELRDTAAEPSASAGIGPVGAAGPTVSLGTPGQTQQQVAVQRWDPDRRELELGAPVGDDGSLLVIPQSINSGWTARLRGPDGERTELSAIAVGGWQQGWILPPGTPAGAHVEIDYPLDGPYRIALAVGPVFGLLVLWLWLARGRDRAGAAARPRRSRPAVWLFGGAATCVLVGGLPGALVWLAAWAALRPLPGRTTAVLPAPAVPILVGGLAAASGVLLARAPWPAPDYGADTVWPQLLVVAAIAVTAAAGGYRVGQDGAGGAAGGAASGAGRTGS